MKQTTVSELKAKLSQYLDAVRRGQEVLVTDRGRPVAKLIAVGPQPDELPPHLLDLQRAGLARVGSGRLPKGFWSLPRPKDPKALARKSLLAEREEGR